MYNDFFFVARVLKSRVTYVTLVTLVYKSSDLQHLRETGLIILCSPNGFWVSLWEQITH